MKSFTLIEVLVVIGIVTILIGLAIPAYFLLQRASDLTNSTEELVNTLRLAQNKTLASEGASSYGVYFNLSTTPHQYVLFKGESYASRDTLFDEIHTLPNSLEISAVDLGGESEVVFERISGAALQQGNISLRLKADPSQTKFVYIDNSGKVDIIAPVISSDAARIKDSRHVHFTYNQNAQNAIILHLIFPDFPADNFDIDFQNYLNPDKTKFYWEGNVSVGPPGGKTEQKLMIQTHLLDLTSAEFSIHRDRRYNDKALEISLDDENLIQFSADGQTQKGSSIHVTDPEWQ